MDFDTPETRPSSWLVPYVGIASAAIVVLTMVWLLTMSQHLFPTAIHENLASDVVGSGRTATAATAQLMSTRARAIAALAANGFPASGIVDGPIERGDDDNRYWAMQTLTVPANDYPRFARLSNRINRLKDPGVSLSFPQIPFQTGLVFLLAAAFVIGSLSAVALETRSADVQRAPKGMHPAIVATQTLMYGVIAALAIFYVHLLGDGIVWAFVAIEGIFIVSLAAWLYQTRRSWSQSKGYRIAWYAYITALLACAIVVIIAATQPVV